MVDLTITILHAGLQWLARSLTFPDILLSKDVIVTLNMRSHINVQLSLTLPWTSCVVMQDLMGTTCAKHQGTRECISAAGASTDMPQKNVQPRVHQLSQSMNCPQPWQLSQWPAPQSHPHWLSTTAESDQ